MNQDEAKAAVERQLTDLDDIPEELEKLFREQKTSSEQIEVIADYPTQHLKMEAIIWVKLRIREYRELCKVFGGPPPNLKDVCEDKFNTMLRLEEKLMKAIKDDEVKEVVSRIDNLDYPLLQVMGAMTGVDVMGNPRHPSPVDEPNDGTIN